MVTPNSEAAKQALAEGGHRHTSSGARLLRRTLSSEYWVLLLSVAYFALLAPFAPGFASGSNLRNIFFNLLPLLIVATGQTFVLIGGGIDLSAPSIVSLASVAGALVMSTQGGLFAGGRWWGVPLGLALMLGAGLLVGILNGAVIAHLRMPPFIVTLTTMMFFGGLAVWLTRSRTISNLPPLFTAIGAKSFYFLPYALVVAGAVVVLAHFLLSRTLFGRWLYAIGHNSRAALVSGVPVETTIVLSYAVSGLCAATASVLYTGRIETGSPVLGQRIFLDVIAAAVIGGTSLFGGRGKILWTCCGVLFITIIDNSLNMLGLSYFVVMMVKGGVILLAALLDVWRARLAR